MSVCLHLVPDKKSGNHLQPLIARTPMAGRVYYLVDDLSFGPVPMDLDNFYPRYQWLESFFGEFSVEAQDLIYFQNHTILTEVDDRLRHPGNQLVLWTEHSANHLCWLAYLSLFFQDWESIDWIHLDEAARPSRLTEQDLPALLELLESRQPPSPSRLTDLQEMYNGFRTNRSLLRVIHEGRLVSRPLDFYDEEITGKDAALPGDDRNVSGEFLRIRRRQLIL